MGRLFVIISSMSFISIFLVGAVFTLVVVFFLWLISLYLNDASIIDIFWGIGFILLTGIYYTLTPDGYFYRKFIILLLVTIWGMRLSIYLLGRNWGRGEDFRYKKWRKQYGHAWWWRSLFQVFILQGSLICLLSVPLLVAQFAALPARITLLDGVGIFVWLVGFCFETIADWQMAQFRSKSINHGHVLTIGLWHYTRHPNYFGEAVLWWGFGLIAASVPFGVFSLFSPLVMTYLLVKISGVSMLEKTLVMTKPDYKAYIQGTSAFFPWFPQEKKEDQNPARPSGK